MQILTYNKHEQYFEAHAVFGRLSTIIAVPVDLKSSQRLPKLLIKAFEQIDPFVFRGKYNGNTDNLEFIMDGPPGYNYKVTVSTMPFKTGDSLKVKAKGRTSNFNKSFPQGSNKLEQNRIAKIHVFVVNNLLVQKF